MKGLSSISPVELTILAVVIGFLAIFVLDNDELNVIGNWVIGIGGIMIIAASQGDYLEGLKNNDCRVENLKQQISLLQKEVESISRHPLKRF